MGSPGRSNAWNPLKVALCATLSLGFQVLAGIWCDFVSVNADEYLRLVPNLSQQINQTTTSIHILDVLCEADFYDVEDDSMFMVSRSFYITSAALGCLLVLIAWSTSICVDLTQLGWKVFGGFCGFVALLQVPVFLVFEAYPCKDFKPEQKCELDLGSFFLIGSVVGWVFTTLLVRCLDPPGNNANLEAKGAPPQQETFPTRLARAVNQSFETSPARSDASRANAGADVEEGDAGSSLRMSALAAAPKFTIRPDERRKEEVEEDLSPRDVFDPFVSLDDTQSTGGIESILGKRSAPTIKHEESSNAIQIENSLGVKPMVPIAQKPMRMGGYGTLESDANDSDDSAPIEAVVVDHFQSHPLAIPSMDSEDQRVRQDWKLLHELDSPVGKVIRGDSFSQAEPDERVQSRLDGARMTGDREREGFLVYGSGGESTLDRILHKRLTHESKSAAPPLRNAQRSSDEAHYDLARSFVETTKESEERSPHLLKYMPAPELYGVSQDVRMTSLHSYTQAENYKTSKPRITDENTRLAPTLRRERSVEQAHRLSRSASPSSGWREERMMRTGIHGTTDDSSIGESSTAREREEVTNAVRNRLRQARKDRIKRSSPSPVRRNRTAESPKATGRRNRSSSPSFSQPTRHQLGGSESEYTFSRQGTAESKLPPSDPSLRSYGVSVSSRTTRGVSTEASSQRGGWSYASTENNPANDAESTLKKTFSDLWSGQ